MAQIARRGSGVMALAKDVRQLISEVGLTLSEYETTRLETNLRYVAAQASDDLAYSERLNPSGGRQQRDFVSSFSKIAKNDLLARRALRGPQTGLTTIHDNEVLIRFRSAVEEMGLSLDLLRKNFDKSKELIAQACNLAIKEVLSKKGRAGRAQLGWYDQFVKLVAGVAEKNGITPQVGTNRISETPSGRFYELIMAFEAVFHPELASLPKKPSSRVSRIRRGLRRHNS